MFICMIMTLPIVTNTLAWLMPNGPEWIILLVLGLLIFGRRLPEVGRSLGKGIVEFKKGIQGIEDEVDEQVQKPTRRVTDGPRQELPPRKTQARERMDSDEDENPYAAVEQPRRDEDSVG